MASPDRADAVFGAMTPVRRIQSVNILKPVNPGPWDGFEGQWRFFGECDPSTDPSVLPGTWCG